MENLITARKVIQNNQEFLIGVFQFRQFQYFTRYTERIIVGYEELDEAKRAFVELTQVRPIYNPQVQRKTNNAKVERIADFLITDPTAMFPTNIVLAIPKEVIDELDVEQENVTIKLNPIVRQELEKVDGNVFLTIVDGQHRIKGIERAIFRIKADIEDPNKLANIETNRQILERLLNLELIVTFFIDPILEYQAMIFSIINKTQTKVPENLVFSLFGLSQQDTPQKTSLEVVLALNGLEKSPFYNRIKLVGTTYKRGIEVPLSQATMVKSILFNICHNQREAEIERTYSRAALKPNPYNLQFRQYYSSNNDRMIVRIMYSFFAAVRETFHTPEGKSLWDLGSTENINVLQTNVGYQALMKILIELLNVIPETEKDNKATYVKYLRLASNLDFIDVNEVKRYPFTSKSINLLYNDLKNNIPMVAPAEIIT